MARVLKAKYPGDAVFSLCGTWRYRLTRNLGGTRTLVSIGLNPSTANGTEDDPTIAKEQRYALAWGLGYYVKVNAYGFRATDPKDMHAARKAGVDIVGPENDAAIRGAMSLAKNSRGVLLAAWSNHIDWERQAAIALIARSLRVPIMCLKVNVDGSAAHTLYLKGDLKPIPWTLPPAPSPKRRRGAGAPPQGLTL